MAFRCPVAPPTPSVCTSRRPGQPNDQPVLQTPRRHHRHRQPRPPKPPALWDLLDMTSMENPAARYIRRSETHIAGAVPFEAAPVRDARGTIAAAIWGLTAHVDVFALYMSLRFVAQSEGQDASHSRWQRRSRCPFSAQTALRRLAAWASTASGLAPRSLRFEAHVSNRRVDVHMAVTPLPGPGEMRVSLVMRDAVLGEWMIPSESILETSRHVVGYE